MLLRVLHSSYRELILELQCAVPLNAGPMFALAPRDSLREVGIGSATLFPV